MYKLVEENELRKLIESQMICDKLYACGFDNWFDGINDFDFPETDDIEKELNKYNLGYPPCCG